MIRKITRGTLTMGSGSSSTSRNISCTITDPDKVVVILNGVVSGDYEYELYLNSVSTSGINIDVPLGGFTFSYQIIEFM